MMPNLRKLLDAALQENQMDLPAHAIDKFAEYLLLLQTWNKVFNLTAITEPQAMVYLHIIDSLTVLPHLHGQQCLDVGSGAGLPGLPLAIANPNLQWTLIDKNIKKIHFLTQAVATLDLKNVTTFHGRVEDFHSKRCFDSILSRALATLADFVMISAHLLCDDGIMIAMKGKSPATEITSLPDTFHIRDVAKINIHGIAAERHLVIIEKS